MVSLSDGTSQSRRLKDFVGALKDYDEATFKHFQGVHVGKTVLHNAAALLHGDRNCELYTTSVYGNDGVEGTKATTSDSSKHTTVDDRDSKSSGRSANNDTTADNDSGNNNVAGVNNGKARNPRRSVGKRGKRRSTETRNGPAEGKFPEGLLQLSHPRFVPSRDLQRTDMSENHNCPSPVTLSPFWCPIRGKSSLNP